MNAGDIVKAVRWCIDEEAVDVSSLDGASDFDFDDETSDIGLMNNIIKGKIPAALRWVCLYAPADQLSGVSSSGGGGEGSGSLRDRAFGLLRGPACWPAGGPGRGASGLRLPGGEGAGIPGPAGDR